ncbi:hypothetical protein D9757_007693 [Collybiopsis confluens]|uniref:Uncharacterized protein n=1 Tax=Collybiopsis confluens TaxID=2823264 RepID=A0A8H5H5M3_9AGAR|nr:hypothetical protein D9757_007693 [Collybiopsis confluens]
MTESYVSPADLAQYYGAQDRVKYWVSTHADHVFTSPNVPPSELDDQDALSSAPSDVESSHSIPPRLTLRYPDGREFPIPHPRNSPVDPNSERNSRSRSNPHSQHSHQRSRSGSSPSAAAAEILDQRREREKLRSHSPEEIRILPSASDETPPLLSGSRHSRSRSLPRDTYSPSIIHDPMPISPSSHHSNPYAASPDPMAETSPPIPVIPSPGPNAGMARTQPLPAPWHPYGSAPRAGPMVPPSRDHFKHSPPSIIYAPSHNSHSNYHPPAILSYRPPVGPNRIFYSHSVPPSQAQIANAGYPLPHGSYAPPPPPPHEERVHRHKRSSDSRHRDRSAGSGKSSKSTMGRKSGRDHSRSLPLEQDYPPPPPEPRYHHHNHHNHHHHHSRHHNHRPSSPAGSDGSGSTYYVLPTARQKVHVLRSPETLYTATSTTQSPTTPVSPTGSIKKPLLQRILGGFADRFSSSGSSKGSLRRRHSTGTRPAGPVSEH